jgi:hypothetical protein
MKIEATTRISYESYRKYYLFNFFQGKRSPWQARLLLMVVPAMFAVFMILYILDTADAFNLIGALIMAAMGFVLLYILIIMPRRYYRSVQKQIEIPNRYAFTDGHMEIRWSDPRGSGSSETRYEMILKAIETNEFFYVFIGPGQVCLIGKQDFTAGTAEDLRELLQAKLRSRFSVKL